MKHKFLEIWYFLQWMIKKLSWTSPNTIVFLLTILILLEIFLPHPYDRGLSLIMVSLLFCSGLILGFKWFIYDPLSSMYQEYKQEQQQLLEKIRDGK